MSHLPLTEGPDALNHTAPGPADPQEWRFGRYRVIPQARQLLVDDQPVKLGSRAFDLLVVLLRAQGEIVAHDEIIRHVWPSTTVDETNLRFQMGELRRALGEDRDLITTIPGRGYLLAKDIVADPTARPGAWEARAAAWASAAPFAEAGDRPAPEVEDAVRGLLLDFAQEIYRVIVPQGAPDHAGRPRAGDGPGAGPAANPAPRPQPGGQEADGPPIPVADAAGPGAGDAQAAA